MSTSRFRSSLRGPSNFEPSTPLTPSTLSIPASNPGSPYDPPHGIDLVSSSSQQFEMHAQGSTVNGVVIGLLSSFGSAIFIALIFIIVYFFKYTAGGRILLDRIGRPGEYDDEQAFLREEAEALEEMDDLQRTEYLRAKGRPGFGSFVIHIHLLVNAFETGHVVLTVWQRLSKQTRRTLYQLIYHCHNI
jgi:hypothetical protein